MKIENITQEELSLIIEALLFSASVDVSANWTQEDDFNMIELASRLNKKCNLKNIELCEARNSENYFAYERIKNNFNIKIN